MLLVDADVGVAHVDVAHVDLGVDLESGGVGAGRDVRVGCTRTHTRTHTDMYVHI